MKHFFWGLFLAFSFYSYSQESINLDFKNEPLKSVLKQLENTFDLRFSYSDIIIEEQYFTFSGKDISLQVVLNKIQQNSDLVFEKVNNRYYIIRKKRGQLHTICAYIFDKSTQEILSKAEIVNNSQGTGTTTNSKGYFELHNVHQNDTITIHFLGFKTQKLLVKDFNTERCTQFFLTPVFEQLEEIVLKEYITQGITQTNDAIIVKPNDLQILPGLTEPDVLESLQSLPGIQSPNETASGLNIRGGTPDQNLILWDDIKVYHSGHFFGTISAFNPYITDEVTVYKNGTNARYGDRISGVIDIQTDKEIPKEVHGGLGFNMTHADAYLKLPLFNKRVGVILSARRSFTDAVNTFTYKKLTKKVFQNSRVSQDQNPFGIDINETKNDFYFSDFNVKAIAEISAHDKFIFSGLFVKNKLDYSASFTDVDFSDTSNDKLRIDNNGLQALWMRNWNKNFNHSLSISSSNYNFDYNGNDQFDELGDLIITKTNDIKDLEVKLNTNIRLSKKSNLELGYQYSSNKVSFLLLRDSYIQNDDFSEEDSAINISHALYGEYFYKKLKKLNMRFGLRVNTLSITDDFLLEPRFNIEAFINKDLRFVLSGEIKNQSISQIIEFETLDFGLENQVWTLANGDLFPILNSKQISLGFNYNRDNWNISIDSYFKKIKGLSSFTRGFSTTTSNFSNGTSSNYGIDFLVKKKIKNYRTWASYSLSWSDFEFDDIENGNTFPGNFDIRHNFNWSHTLQMGKFNFSLGWRYRTGKPFTQLELDEQEGVVTYNSINDSRLPEYHRLDFSSTYRFNISKDSKVKGKLGFSILNIYDRKNVLNKSYFIAVNSSNNSELIESNLTALRIAPNLVFRVYF